MFRSTCLLLVCVAGSACLAQDKKPDPTADQIQNIIKTFAQHETEFSNARENYTYRQSIKMSEVDPPGGTYEMVEEVSFDERDRRVSHVTYAPVNGLVNLQMTREDEQDFQNVYPYVLTTEALGNYDIKYIGREQVDEIGCYVFTAAPKSLTRDRKRYFEGQIWVDDQDLQIVKTDGKSTGYLRRGEDQQFPKFVTYRQQIDGKYWFPVYTYADDTLHFKDGPSQRIKVIVKYDHYKKYVFKTESTIKYGDAIDSGAKNNAPAANPPANGKSAK